MMTLAECCSAQVGAQHQDANPSASSGQALGHRLIVVLLLAFSVPLSAADSGNQQITPANVLGVTERVADWQLTHPSAHPTTDWTQGAGNAGMLALTDISRNPKYREALLVMGQMNGWKPGPRMYHADDLAVGQAYAGLYLIYRDPKMIAPLQARLNAILAAPPKVQSLDFHQPYEQVSQLWSWCDALLIFLQSPQAALCRERDKLQSQVE